MRTGKKAENVEIHVVPIGQVRKRSEYEGTIQIEKAFRGALKELDHFSHIQVFWWCHLSDNEELRRVIVCQKPYRKAPDSVGVFATRSERRPNPVALTVVPALHIDHGKGRIHIPYIDAEDGTPVIDIKPYHPATDRVREATVPEWCDHWPQWYEDSAAFDWEAELNMAG